MRAAGRRWPRRVKVLDWVAYSAGHRDWFWGDGLHLAAARGAGASRDCWGAAFDWSSPAARVTARR